MKTILSSSETFSAHQIKAMHDSVLAHIVRTHIGTTDRQAIERGVRPQKYRIVVEAIHDDGGE